MQRILLSALVVGGVVGAAVYGTTAFFSDSETSTNNTFTAGALDLTIDSTAHYNGMVCENVGSEDVPNYQWQLEDEQSEPIMPELLNTACTGTWTAQDLEGNPLFDYADIKPGDFGENTISVHVENNDAWFRMKVTGKENHDNTPTEPELDADATTAMWCGELAQNMRYSLWNDEGGQVGWQGSQVDPLEGNNIFDGGFEVYAAQDELVLDPGLAAAVCADPNLAANLVVTTSPAVMLAAGETQYVGVSWNVPNTVGNEIQTDSVMFDVDFEVEQYRNNPSPFPTP